MPGADPDRHLELRRRGRTGGAEGRGVRRRAARRGRHLEQPVRVRAGAYLAGRAVGRRPGGAAAAARPPRRGARRRGGLADRPVRRRDPRGVRLGPRCGRHEGLRRDGALGGPGAGPGRRPPEPADRALLHRRRGGGRPQGRPAHRRAARRRDRGLHRGGRRGRRLHHHGARQADLPHRGRREGHGLDEADRPRQGRARLDDQPRQRGHRARRCGGPDRRPPVAGPADPGDGGAARRRSPTSPAPRRRRRTPSPWWRSSRAPRGCSAR